jgi:hypothetical protein
MMQYGGYIIEPFGRVYMGVQATDLEYKTRHRLRVQDTDPISILIYHVYNMYTLTSPRSRSGSVVNNCSVANS